MKTRSEKGSKTGGLGRQSQIAVFVATSGHSGVDRVIGNLVRQFDGWGIRVDLLRVRDHGPDLSTDALPNVRVVDLGSSHVITSLPALVRYLRRERPTAMLTDKDRVNRTALLARKLAGVKTRLAVRIGTTVSVNLASRGAFERWLQRNSMRWLYPMADCVLVPSDGVRDDLASYTGIGADRIRVVRSPIVTPEIFRQAREPVDHPWLSGREMPVILGVGELGYRKDFETLVRAFALVRRNRPCRLIILGEGRRRQALLSLGQGLGVGEDMDLPGFKANPYAFMAGADLFVLSSRWEGMPVVLVEALALGTRVVATDCPSGPREIIQAPRLGALVPVGAVAAMADAIADGLAPSGAGSDVARAVRDYHIEVSARAYLDALGVEHSAFRATDGVDGTALAQRLQPPAAGVVPSSDA